MKKAKDYIMLLNEKGVDKLIEIVKTEGIFINSYSGKMKEKDKKLIEEISAMIQEHEKVEWENYLRDISIINDIYRRFYSNPINDIVQTVNPIEAYLLVTEQFLFYINNIIVDEESYNVKMNLNFVVKENSGQERKKYYMDLHDRLTRNINHVLASLIFYEFPNRVIDVQKSISQDEIKCSYNHFNNVAINDILNYAIDAWKYGGRKIYKKDSLVTFKMLGTLDESYYIINQRNESRDNKCWLTVSQAIVSNGKHYPKGRRLNEYINLEEYITCFYLMNYLNTYDLYTCTYSVSGIENEDVSIRELVRAYYVLAEVSKDKVNNYKLNNNTLEDWGIVLEKREIEILLQDADIKLDKVGCIIEQLTYRKGVDIFDAPLISFEDKYLLMPHFLINVDVGKVVLSRINEIFDRGKLFENEINRIFKEKGIRCSSLFYQDSEQYQCDLVFAIAEDLYICECKAWNEMKSINGYYEILQKMEKAKNQIDRIANKFSKELLYLINDKLGFEKEHTFKKINKIVITLNMLGLERKIDDVFFVDFSCLMKFLDREKPGIRQYGKKQRFYQYSGFEEYEGNITNYKFMSMIKFPANIEYRRKNKKEGINEILLDGLTVQIPMYTPAYPEIKYVK